jgi:basic amino acid/polyamine antiporter, APA family
MTFLKRRKSLDAEQSIGSGSRLRRTLGWPHLVALGVGAIIGTGIYTLVGIGAGRAGPAVILAFVIAGIVCACAALAYAEMATMMPVSGSAYTYTYAVAGELPAWVVGWSLILEYTVVCSAVAVGWSGYAAGFLKSIGVDLPTELLQGPYTEGGVFNLPAAIIVFAVAGMLLVGTRESATVNGILVAVKVVALLVFMYIAFTAFDASNFTPFMPYGFSAHVDGNETRGVMAAAAIIFFAFYGFDAVSTAAEETRNPGRDLVFGIVGSMVVCTIIYIGVAAAALGAMSYTEFASSPEPLAHVLRTLQSPVAANLIAAAAIVALPTVILAFLYGQTRIFFVMARDGLLPARLGGVSARTGTPVTMTIATAVIVALIAGLFPLAQIAELANAGTLAAFIAVSGCVMALRILEPTRPRAFRTPLVWIVGPAAIVGCIYLFFSLPEVTRQRFYIWTAIGVVVYFLYAIHNSHIGKAARGV